MKRILVIDDEPALAKSLATVLESEGYEVFCAATGREGIERAQKLLPDLVILDYMMPGGLSGADVGGALRAGNLTTGMKILMSSSLPEVSVRQRFAEYDAYAHKPYDVDATLTLIADLIEH